MNLGAGSLVRRRPDARDPSKRCRDASRVGLRAAAGNDRDAANDLAMAAHIASNYGEIDVGMFANECEKMLRIEPAAVIELEDTGLTRERDALENLLGRFRAESTNGGEAAVARGLLELVDVRDLELLVNL